MMVLIEKKSKGEGIKEKGDMKCLDGGINVKVAGKKGHGGKGGGGLNKNKEENEKGKGKLQKCDNRGGHKKNWG